MGPMPWMADEWLCVHYHPRPSVHHRDIHSPPQVSKGCTGIRGADPESMGVTLLSHPSLTTTLVSELHREMFCSAEWKPSGLCSALWGLWRPLRAVHWGCCQLSWGDRAGNSPVNFNTSMHRKSHSHREERHVHRKQNAVRSSSICLGREQSLLLTLYFYFKCTLPWCAVPVKSSQLVPPTPFNCSDYSWLLNIAELYTSAHSWTLKQMII